MTGWSLTSGYGTINTWAYTSGGGGGSHGANGGNGSNPAGRLERAPTAGGNFLPFFIP